MAIEFQKITQEESWGIFDAAARRWLHVDARTFVERWDAGSYADDSDPAVMRVAMLRPGGR